MYAAAVYKYKRKRRRNRVCTAAAYRRLKRQRRIKTEKNQPVETHTIDGNQLHLLTYMYVRLACTGGRRRVLRKKHVILLKKLGDKEIMLIFAP